MIRVGDKYIVEIDKVFLDSDGNKLYKIKGFNSLVFDEDGFSRLTKYVESKDSNKSTKQAYHKGWNDGVQKTFEIMNRVAEELAEDDSRS